MTTTQQLVKRTDLSCKLSDLFDRKRQRASSRSTAIASKDNQLYTEFGGLPITVGTGLIKQGIWYQFRYLGTAGNEIRAAETVNTIEIFVLLYAVHRYLQKQTGCYMPIAPQNFLEAIRAATLPGGGYVLLGC